MEKARKYERRSEPVVLNKSYPSKIAPPNGRIALAARGKFICENAKKWKH
jgi:hypothetical protein